MASDIIVDAVPAAEIPQDDISKPEVSKPAGLSSPPDSNNALNLDDSDSELSDLEDEDKLMADVSELIAEQPKQEEKEKKDLGEIHPDYYADDGRVPVFKPSMYQFEDFEAYMSAINSYGMQSGIVKIIPPKEWVDAQPPLDDVIKTVKVREPIKQDIMGTSGTYRQANILHQRSYNLPQWRQLCEQSEHQPPAKRGERRANQDKPPRPSGSRKSEGTPRPSTPSSAGQKKGRGRPSKKAKLDVADQGEGTPERLPTPVSPSTKVEDDVDSIKPEPELEEDITPTAPRRMGGIIRPKTTSVSSRRKYGRREAAGKIDEAAFKDFDYRMDIDEYTPERCEELERAYWKTLTYAPPLYGADMLGSLFTTDTKIWNLGKLPNLLDVMGQEIPGVNTAYLYLGMWKATFAWHLEDVDLYSINYLHFGAPKQWYSISQRDARKFEAAMKSIWPVDAKACDQFLRHKTFLISPSTLLSNHGIRVNKVTHFPGEFVVTFPYGYHSGFNMGYNCAEAVNFALPYWLDMGKLAKKCDCDQAQDSVWIDAYQIERRWKGEETEYEETEDEEDEDDEDGPVDLPTPPESSGDTKPKQPRRKRKRPTADKDGAPAGKRLRMRLKVGAKEPCCLCPHDIASEPLLATEDGRKAHRICAEYTPETEIENNVVVNLGGIAKARMELKCYFCHSRKGACFQCSQKKCARAYHATCAAAAGVFVEQGETSVFGEDGTEYKTHGIEFSCRFHRTKRDKKLEGETLEEDPRIRKAASALAVGETCQIQFYRGDIWAGVVVENRRSEEMLLLDVLPKGERFEVAYKWLLLPDPADYRMQKPSANAIPLPPRQSLVTSKRQANDLPRKDDEFLPGFMWAEFNPCNIERNAAQVKLDLEKENQVFYYLGKTSTEAKAQYTEDANNPRYNPKCNFLDTLPKPAPPPPAPKQSFSASYPGVNQHALNAARVSARPQNLPVTAKMDKPYQYKPRPDSYRIDPQAYRSQQTFLQQSTGVAYSFANDPRWRQGIDWMTNSHLASRTPTSQAPKPQQPQYSSFQRLSPATPSPITGNNPFSKPPVMSNNSGRATSSGSNRYSARPNPFAKYPYLQKQHNRSPLDYKSPYSQSGGFMNGYEGDLKAFLKKNPDALFQKRASLGSSSSSINMLGYNATQRPSYAPILPPARSSHSPAAGVSPSSSSVTPVAMSQQQASSRPQSSSSSINLWEKKDTNQLHPAIRQEYGTLFHQQYQQTPTKQEGSRQQTPVASQNVQAPKKEYPPILPPSYVAQKAKINGATNATAEIHPLQRQFAAQTQTLPQPPKEQAQQQAQQQARQQPPQQLPQEQQVHAQPQTTLSAPQEQSLPQIPLQAQRPVQTQAPIQHPVQQPKTPFALAYEASNPRPLEESNLQPMYAHQQYFQKLQPRPFQEIRPQPQPHPQFQVQPAQPQLQPQQQLQFQVQLPLQPQQQSPQEPGREVPEVPADSTSLVEQMMVNLRRASAHSSTGSNEPF